MKKIIFIIILCCPFMVNACDICGCGVGSYYVGILPEFNKHILGLRYQYKTLRTHIGAGGTTTYLTTNETYRTLELWGAWNIGKRFRIMGTIPVNFNERIDQGVKETKTGLGDMSFAGFYQLFNTRHTIKGNNVLIQSLWIGGGVKLPTGKYEPLENNGESVNIFQSGTGSVDFTLNAMYDIRLQDFGINSTVSYKMNTKNTYDYRYGNKFSANVQAYYKIKVSDAVRLSPNAGILYETADKDMDGKYMVDVSGGNVLLAATGLEATVKRTAIGFSWQKPLSQKLANDFVQANNRVMVHVSFLL